MKRQLARALTISVAALLLFFLLVEGVHLLGIVSAPVDSAVLANVVVDKLDRGSGIVPGDHAQGVRIECLVGNYLRPETVAGTTRAQAVDVVVTGGLVFDGEVFETSNEIAVRPGERKRLPFVLAEGHEIGEPSRVRTECGIDVLGYSYEFLGWRNWIR